MNGLRVKENNSRQWLAFTLIEALIIVVILALLLFILLPSLAGAKRRAQRQRCVENLKQVGLAFKQLALDGDRYQMEIEAAYGGSAESVTNGEVFRHFQVMSNELNTPKILICPTDQRVASPDFKIGFSNTNISYFVGVDAQDSYPEMLLVGDRNLTNGSPMPNGLLFLTTNSAAGWTHELHRLEGNIGLGDGSVQHFDMLRLRAALRNMGGYGTNRLAIP